MPQVPNTPTQATYQAPDIGGPSPSPIPAIAGGRTVGGPVTSVTGEAVTTTGANVRLSASMSSAVV